MSLHEVLPDILRLSAELDSVGTELLTMSKEMAQLKSELFIWEVQQSEKIREQEKDGKLKMKSGNEVKLTDAIRASLTHLSNQEKFAKYESLKLKLHVLEIAVKAKSTALSGYQTQGNIIKKELEPLKYQP